MGVGATMGGAWIGQQFRIIAYDWLTDSAKGTMRLSVEGHAYMLTEGHANKNN